MENHTKRMRKARRQGLADHGKNLGRAPRVRFASPLAGTDLPGTPRANERRQELSTGRKARRRSARRAAPPARRAASSR